MTLRVVPRRTATCSPRCATRSPAGPALFVDAGRRRRPARRRSSSAIALVVETSGITGTPEARRARGGCRARQRGGERVGARRARGSGCSPCRPTTSPGSTCWPARSPPGRSRSSVEGEHFTADAFVAGGRAAEHARALHLARARAARDAARRPRARSDALRDVHRRARRRPGHRRTPLRDRAEPGIRVIRTYGSSETSGGCVYDGVPIGTTTVRVEDGEVGSADRRSPRATSATRS